MWTPGPFETKPTRAYYYLTDVDPSWPADRQDEHLRDFNFPTLWSISIHEVYPGHFLHYQHLRRVESKTRKSIMFAPASFVEGWAHYCEQMMIEAGFGRQDYGVALTANFEVDAAATERLRATMPRRDGEFSHGPGRTAFEAIWTLPRYDALHVILRRSRQRMARR